MADHILTMKDVKKVFPGGKTILNGLYLSFYSDAKIGVLGHNGAGKSTFLKIIAGLDKEIYGEMWVRSGTKIGYLPQEPQLDLSKNVKDNILSSVQETLDLLEKFNAVSMKFADPDISPEEMDQLIEEQDLLQQKIEADNAWDLERHVDITMDALRCPPSDADISTLSGGEKRRVALCKLLLEKNDILLLDEPTNHLDAESVAWLERYLREYKGMVLIVTHDRYFLDNVTGWILELDRGEGIPYEGNYTSWLQQKQKRLEQEEREESARQRVLKSELEWISASPKARQSKNKARVNAYEELLNKSVNRNYESSLMIPDPEKLGGTVIELKNITKSFGDKLLIDDFSFVVPKGAIVGIIGANGAGKSTLFKIITGTEVSDSGTVKIGDKVKLGYVDQSRDSLDNNKNVWEEISNGHEEMQVGNRVIQSRSYVAQFNFKGPDQQKKIGVLSGGERNRVHLAKMLKSGANVLLLDEPTNDLDLETLRALEKAILDYTGCVLVISHDRWFLDRICTHIISFEGDSKVIWNEGNFQDYEQDKIKRLGLESIKPKRIQYKSIKI